MWRHMVSLLCPDDTRRGAAGLCGVVFAGWLHPSRGCQKAPDDWSRFLYSYSNGECGLIPFFYYSALWSYIILYMYIYNTSLLHTHTYMYMYMYLLLPTSSNLHPSFFWALSTVSILHFLSFPPPQGYGLFLFTAKEHAWSIESHSLIAVPVVSTFHPHQILYPLLLRQYCTCAHAHSVSVRIHKLLVLLIVQTT